MRAFSKVMEESAARAQSAINTYQIVSAREHEDREILLHLLTDIRHYCHVQGINFSEVNEESWFWWHDELTEQQEAA
jgi:hypothetical protein